MESGIRDGGGLDVMLAMIFARFDFESRGIVLSRQALAIELAFFPIEEKSPKLVVHTFDEGRMLSIVDCDSSSCWEREHKCMVRIIIHLRAFLPPYYHLPLPTLLFY